VFAPLQIEARGAPVAARVLVRAVVVVICAAAVVAAVRLDVAQVRLQDAFTTFQKTGDAERALRDLRASRSPLNPNPLRETGFAYSLLVTGHPAQAESVIAGAARREPSNPKPWLELTRIQLARGHTAAARASWAHLRKLVPRVGPALPAPAGGAPRRG
jgi:Flp pilus assembly protein TadD